MLGGLHMSGDTSEWRTEAPTIPPIILVTIQGSIHKQLLFV